MPPPARRVRLARSRWTRSDSPQDMAPHMGGGGGGGGSGEDPMSTSFVPVLPAHFLLTRCRLEGCRPSPRCRRARPSRRTCPGPTDPSPIRKPLASTTASRSGTADWRPSRTSAAAESSGCAPRVSRRPARWSLTVAPSAAASQRGGGWSGCAGVWWGVGGGRRGGGGGGGGRQRGTRRHPRRRRRELDQGAELVAGVDRLVPESGCSGAVALGAAGPGPSGRKCTSTRRCRFIHPQWMMPCPALPGR